MDPILLWAYLSTIVILVMIILVIKVMWGDYFPRQWLILLSACFISLIGGLCALLASELLAPYNAYFYLHPFSYLIFIGLLGCSLFAIYLLIVEMHFKHIGIVQIAGWVAFSGVICFIVISGILLQSIDFLSYIWMYYASVEFVLGLGIAAFTLVAIGSFSDSGSDRLDRETRRGLEIIGIFGFCIAGALAWIAIGVVFIDFSVPLNPAVSIFWLLWLMGVEVLFLLMVYKAVHYIT